MASTGTHRMPAPASGGVARAARGTRGAPRGRVTATRAPCCAVAHGRAGKYAPDAPNCSSIAIVISSSVSELSSAPLSAPIAPSLSAIPLPRRLGAKPKLPGRQPVPHKAIEGNTHVMERAGYRAHTHARARPLCPTAGPGTDDASSGAVPWASRSCRHPPKRRDPSVWARGAGAWARGAGASAGAALARRAHPRPWGLRRIPSYSHTQAPACSPRWRGSKFLRTDGSSVSPLCVRRIKLFPTHFKQLYPGHPNLDSYIFGGGGAAPDAAALQQVRAVCLAPCSPVPIALSARPPASMVTRWLHSALMQVGSSSRTIPTASLKSALGAGLKVCTAEIHHVAVSLACPHIICAGAPCASLRAAAR